jgi:hypothetical protein
MSIKCGHCQGYHNTVAEVRSCSTNSSGPQTLEDRARDLVTNPPLARWKTGGATPKQLSLIEQLYAERETFGTTPDSLAPLTKKGASDIISWLFDQPKLAVAGARDAAVANTAPTKEIPVGTYTVGDDNDYITIKVEKAKWADGQTVLSFLSGSDNEVNYTGFAFLTDAGLKVWKRFREESRPIAAAQFLLTGNVDEAHEWFLNLAEAFALESGNCMRCGRKLTVPASLHRGLGPVCAGIEGV